MESEWRNPDGSVNYRKYINSQEWRRFREDYWKRHRSEECERCGRSDQSHQNEFSTHLHLHHKTYETIGKESDDDLERICKPCHDKEHGGFLGTPQADMRGVATGFTYPDQDDPEWEEKALLRIAARRVRLGRRYANDPETLWRELKRLQWLEDYVRACQLLKHPDVNYADDHGWTPTEEAYPDEKEIVWFETPTSSGRAKFEDGAFWTETEELIASVTHWSRKEQKTVELTCKEEDGTTCVDPKLCRINCQWPWDKPTPEAHRTAL